MDPASFDALEVSLISVFSEDRYLDSETVDEKSCVAFLEARYRIIQLDGPLYPQANLRFLDKNFLGAARGGQKSIAATTIGARATDGISYRTKAIIASVAAGHGAVLSPFTGQIEPVQASLGIEWVYHAVNGHFCLLSQLGSVMVSVHLETVWLFPQHRLILFVGNGQSEAQIIAATAHLLSRCLRYAAALHAYLFDPELIARRRLALTDFPCPHMSHNLWNIQTGWSNVLQCIDVGRVDRFFCFENQNFFGALDALFRDKGIARQHLHFVKDVEDAFVSMLANNMFLLTVKDEFFTADFAGRVMRWARGQCSSEFLQEVERFRDSAKPLVVTTVRLDNRSWLEQETGIPTLFSKLQEMFPKIGLVIDGLSADTVRGWTTACMSVENDLDMAKKIANALPADMPVFVAVGRCFTESLVLIDCADLFVAPSGSGMALYKWISNQPGLAFSNRTVLDHQNRQGWPLRIWHDRKYREALVPTTHLSYELVTDTDDVHQQRSRANFHLNWHHIYKAVIPLIKALPAGRTGCTE